MFRNSLKSIAVFTSELQSEYQRIICHNISVRAKELNYNVAVFNWNNPYGQLNMYLKGEAEILKLPDYSRFDGVIYLKDTFGEPNVEQALEDLIKNQVSGPCVAIRTEVKGYYNIFADGGAGIEKMVEHFIVKHNCKRIVYMSGPRNRSDACLRLDAYKKVMDKYNLEYDESCIFYGTFWKDKGVEAVDYFLNSPHGIPDAIVCANDFMAISVLHELIERGYKIPEDILISGFDNTNEAIENVPSLTTIDLPIAEMAMNAVDIINDVINGKDRSLTTIVDSKPVFRDTCGCGDGDVWTAIRDRIRTNVDYNNSVFIQRQLRFFTVELEATNSLNEICDVIDNYMYINGSYNNCFICLTKDPHNNQLDIVSSIQDGYSSESVCALAIIDRAHTDDYPFVFSTGDLIPAAYTNEEPQMYFFSPLHFLDRNYGYIAISFYDNMGLSKEFYTFTTHISNALDSLKNKRKLEKTLKDLEKLYISDPMTGLFNRRGFEIKAAELFNKCKDSCTPVMVMGIDMDGLKHINDTFGHQQGDLAIQLLGKALIYSSLGKEICARVGGDEFNVIAGDYTEEETQRFISNLNDFIDSYNKVSDTEYMVTASYGYIIVDNFDNCDKELEYYLNLSDDRMYKQKAIKKQSHNDCDC